MYFPSELQAKSPIPKESSEPIGIIAHRRYGKCPSEQSKVLVMYRDLFLNGNADTFIVSKNVPWQRIFRPTYLPMAI